MVGGRSDVARRVGLAMVALLALILLISAPSAEGFGWWGNSVPVSQIVEEGTEKMGQHLTTFFEMCDRFISARQKKWATESSSSTQDGDEEEAAAQGNDSPFLVERIFHPSAKAKQGMKRAPISNSTDRCSEPFGVSHPACDSTYACSITQMACEGVNVNPQTYNGSLAGCTVNKVNCASGPIPKLAKDECVLRDLTCNGAHVGAADAPPGAAATCSVYQLMCNNTLLNFDPSMTACDGKVGEEKCESVCKDAGDVCMCTLDRVGSTCARWRPYTCSFRLLSPTPNCKPIPGVDSDPVCFVFHRTQTVKFEYSIDCAFDNELDPLALNSQEFEYFLRTDKFAVSKAQTDLWTFQAQLKVFDFKWITDRTATQVTDLTPLQLAGNNSVAFNLNFEQIPERFFAGNRLYFEFGLSRDSAVAGRTIKYDRRFLDFEGLHISRTNHSALSAVQISWIIAISIFGFFFLVLVGYWIRNKIIACRRPKEHDY